MEKEVVISTRGLRAKILTQLPDSLVERINSARDAIWYDIEDLNRYYQFIRFPYIWVGKVQQVSELLAKAGYTVKVVSAKRSPGVFDFEYTGKPRAGQIECVDALVKHRRGFVKASTGSGKTHIIVAVTARLKKPTLVVVYNTAPFQQLVDTATEFSNIKFGIWSEGVKQQGDVIFANIQTLASIMAKKKSWRKDWITNECKVLIFDECHHSVSDGSLNLLLNMPDVEEVFGFTATPYRTDSRQPIFDAIFGKRPLGTMTYAHNIDKGNSVPITVTIVDGPKKDYGYVAKRGPTWLRKRQYQMVVKDYIIGGANGRHKLITDLAKEQMSLGRTVLISVSKVPQAEALYHRLRPDAEILVASGPFARKGQDREAILEAFRNREIKCLISTVVREAVDVPSLDSLILCMEGKSKVMVEQSLRNTRSCDKLLTTGHYKKERGYVFYIKNQCDFLKSQSDEFISELKRIVKSHPCNELIESKPECKPNKRKNQPSSQSSLATLLKRPG